MRNRLLDEVRRSFLDQEHRRAGRSGRRVAHGQLMLVRPRDAKSFMLAQVRWLMAARNGDLLAGVRLLPGVPTAVAVRPTGLNAQNEKYQPALVLGAWLLLLYPGTRTPHAVADAGRAPASALAATARKARSRTIFKG